MANAEIRQDTLTALGDGVSLAVPMARMGVPAAMSIWDYFALAGRMFTLKQTTIGTAVAGSAANAAGIVLTAPSIRFTVPTGYTVFPRRFNASFATLAGIDNEIAIMSGQTDTYTSGGTAITPLNLRTDQPIATVVTNCYIAAGSAIVEAALTATVRAHYQSCIPLADTFATSYTLEKTIEVVWPDLRPVVGPASFLVFLSAKTTASTWYFSLDWAEVATSNVKAG